MVSRCLHAGCASEFASASQLDVHVAFKHVPVEEITFTCAKCKAQFHTGTMLLKHKMDTHQDVDDAAVSPSLCHVLAGGQHTLTDGNGVDEDKDKENAAPAKKHRYQCNRCPYGTEHSAWLLQKHVIYEHLVDALGGARDYDAHLHVPMIAKARQHFGAVPASCMDYAYDADGEWAAGYYGDAQAGYVPYGADVGVVYDCYDGHDVESGEVLERSGDDGDSDYEPPVAKARRRRARKRHVLATPAAAAERQGRRGTAAAVEDGAGREQCPHCPYTTDEPRHLRNHVFYLHKGGTDAKQQPCTSGAAGAQADKLPPTAPAPRHTATPVDKSLMVAMMRSHRLVDIAAATGCSKSTVHSVLQRYRLEGHLETRVRPGRRRALTDEQSEAIVRWARADPSLSQPKLAAMATAKFGVNVFRSTVLRTLRKFGTPPDAGAD